MILADERSRGTPGSGTTSLSALSTTAIKDGHQGHAPPHVSSHGHQHSTSSISSTNTLDAERADRISRLAGLERVATARGTSGTSHLAPGAVLSQPPGYFDGTNAQLKERSTVGSASATGSVGGTRTWASSSDVNDADKMSEDQDDGVSSMGGFSDEGTASLVGFGEGATSTADGPVSAGLRSTGRQSSLTSPNVGKANAPSYAQQSGSGTSAMLGVGPSQQEDAKMIDGMTYDSDVVDTVNRTPHPVSSRHANSTGRETAERLVRERLEEGEQSRQAMSNPDDGVDGGKNLGQFYFEEK